MLLRAYARIWTRTDSAAAVSFFFLFLFFLRNGAFRCRGNVNRIVCLLLFVAVVVLV